MSSLLMERDQYWPCNPDCDESPTLNSAPIWTVARSAWEAAGGDVAGTADPPENRKFGGEGTRTDRVTIGAARLGKGRVAIFGALLPQPSEEHDHWFGVNSYTVSVPGQTMLLRALRWGEGATPAPKPCTSRRRILVHLARGARRGRVTVAGRRAKVRRVSGRLVALVDLRGRRAGRVTVKVTSVMGSGKRVTQVRRFRTCARR